MPSDSKFTRDDDGNVAVRVVSNTGVSEQPESMFTTDEDGNVAVRVVFGEGGGGGGDSHNKGFYATPTALNEAIPTAEAGDFAIVGSTDTVWIWDTDNSEWVDSDQKGQVTSVNNQTGAVTITGDDILPSQTNNSGKFLTTNGTTASWGNALTNKTTALGAVVIAPGNAGNISVGNYGVCVGNDTKTVGDCGVSVGYSAGRLNSNSKYAICIGYNNAATAIGAYQFGSGTNSEAGTVCFALNTDGNNAHWHNYKVLDSDGTVPSDRLVHAINKYSTMPTAASTNEGWIVQFTGTTDSTYTHGHLYECMSDGGNPATYSWTEVQLGGGSSLPSQTGNAGKFLVTDGTDASWSDTVGQPLYIKSAGLYYAGIVELKGYNNNNDILQMNMSPNTGSFEIDVRNNSGTRTGWYFFDSAFYPHATMTTSTLGKSTNVWANVFTAKINNGADITVPNATGEMVVNKATDSTSVSILGESNGYSKSVAVGQNAMTRGETVAVGYSSQVESRNIAIGYAASAKTSFGGSVAIGHSANADISSAGWKASVAIGPNAKANASGSIQISATKSNSTTVTPTNTDANTFKVSNDNGNYEMMSADGTIPTARLTKVNSTITLAAADWSSNTQTVNVTGMTATGVVFVGPDPADQSAYTSAGVLCTAQAAGTLTFACDTVPSGDIDVNVVML